MPKCTTSTSPWSRNSSRYLPFRSIFVIFRPASRSANSLRLAWRRMMRIAFRCGRTSTSLMRRPTTSFSRSRRTTSTSGSSTQPSCTLAGTSLAPLARQACVRLAGGPLLRLFLRPARPSPQLAPSEVDGRGELLLVVGPSLLDAILGEASEVLCGELLERRLVIAVALAADIGLDPRMEEALDHLARDVDPPVEIHRAEHRLHRVGEDARLVPSARELLASAEKDRLAQAELLCHLREHGHVHHGRAELRELALGEVRVRPVGEVGDDQAEDRVEIGRAHV